MCKNICSKHIKDYAIEGYIKEEGYIGTCYYCGDFIGRKVVDFEELIEFMEKGIGYHYEDAANSMGYDSSEGGYLGTTHDTYDLLRDVLEVEIDNNVFDDVLSALPDNAWCAVDPYGDNDADILKYHWEGMKRVIKHKARYSFLSLSTSSYGDRFEISVQEMLDSIGELISKYKMLKPLTSKYQLIRCRQHKDKIGVRDIHEVLSPPDDKVTFSNRMSPAGISMFYCAFSQSLAYKETIDTLNKSCNIHSIGGFEVADKMNVIDFSRLPKLPSEFDLKKRDDYYPILFLKGFIDDLTKPIIRDGKQHIEYIPTQVITEYIRYVYSKKNGTKIDGIIYPSAKSIVTQYPLKKRENACVLFLNHEESKHRLNFKSWIVRNKHV